MLKTIKRFLIEGVLLLAKLVFFWIPGDYYKGYALLAFHLIAGLGLYFAFFISSKPTRLLIGIIFAIILLQQLLLRTCILTKAEALLHKDDVTIIDPLLMIAGVDQTKDVRYASSLCFMMTVVSTVWFCICSQDWKWASENIEFVEHFFVSSQVQSKGEEKTLVQESS